MRRKYAFEAEGISEEVKSQLEKVEDVVEDKCTTEEACDKMLEKIGDEKEKFDNALQTMADAAKDCKDGKCDKAEMAEKITPKMAELKEVAKSIGVASEGEALTEAELKDARDYLNGVEEIVEAKKDEVCDGSCEKSEGEEPESDDDEGAETEAEEAWLMIPGMESYEINSMDDMVLACESEAASCYVAMEGYNWDKRKEWKAIRSEIRNLVKTAKNAAKQGDVAKAKSSMEAATAKLTEYKKQFVEAAENEQGVGDAIFGYFAYGWRGLGLELLAALPTFGLGAYVVALKHGIEFWVDLGQAIAKGVKGEKKLTPADFNMYTKSMEHNMDLMIAQYKKVAKSIDAKALKNAKKLGKDTDEDKKDAPAEESATFDGFISACESYRFGTKDMPYLFG